MRSIKTKVLSVLMIICVLTCSFTFNVSAELTEGTVFEAVLSGKSYGIRGESYTLTLNVGNFTEEEFLGVTCDIDYDKEVFEVDSAYLEIINGSGDDAEIYPLIDSEEGWIFIGANREGMFTVTILNDSDLVSLKGDSVSCFVKFKVKESASVGETLIKIDTDDFLLGTFSETNLDSKLGTGSSLSVNITDEKPYADTIVLKENTSCVRKNTKINNLDVITGFRERTNVSDFLLYFENEIEDLRVVKGTKVLSNNSQVPSGAYIQLLNGDNVVDSVLIILKGDVDASGIVTATDYLEIKNYLKNQDYVLDDWAVAASDIDDNGIISSTDYLLVKSYFLGSLDFYT